VRLKVKSHRPTSPLQAATHSAARKITRVAESCGCACPAGAITTLEIFAAPCVFRNTHGHLPDVACLLSRPESSRGRAPWGAAHVCGEILLSHFRQSKSGKIYSKSGKLYWGRRRTLKRVTRTSIMSRFQAWEGRMIFAKRPTAISLSPFCRLVGRPRSGASPRPDFPYRKVVTVDPAFSIAEGVRFAASVSSRSAPTSAVRRLAGPATREIDCGGRTVIPGLMDGHLHNAARGLGVDLAGVRSMAELLAAVEARVEVRQARRRWWCPTRTGTRRSSAKAPAAPQGLDRRRAENPVVLRSPAGTSHRQFGRE